MSVTASAVGIPCKPVAWQLEPQRPQWLWGGMGHGRALGLKQVGSGRLERGWQVSPRAPAPGWPGSELAPGALWASVPSQHGAWWQGLPGLCTWREKGRVSGSDCWAQGPVSCQGGRRVSRGRLWVMVSLGALALLQGSKLQRHWSCGPGAAMPEGGGLRADRAARCPAQGGAHGWRLPPDRLAGPVFSLSGRPWACSFSDDDGGGDGVTAFAA